MFGQKTKPKPLPVTKQNEQVKKVKELDTEDTDYFEEENNDDLFDEEEEIVVEPQAKNVEDADSNNQEEVEGLTEEVVKRELTILNHRLARIEHHLRLDFF